METLKQQRHKGAQVVFNLFNLSITVRDIFPTSKVNDSNIKPDHIYFC